MPTTPSAVAPPTASPSLPSSSAARPAAVPSSPPGPFPSRHRPRRRALPQRTRPLQTLPLRLLPALLTLLLLPLALLLPAVPAAGQGDQPPRERPPSHDHVDRIRGEATDRGLHRGHDSSEGRCVSDCDCPAGELCSADSATCETVSCIQVYDPVCGLDGKTYGNDCQARAAHVVVAHPGECARTCGGIAGEACPDGHVCDLPAGQCRGRDLQGQCKERPNLCSEQFDPVCGCDGTTYGNDCKRLQAGAQKAYDGRCRGGDREPPACRDDDDCARDAYCDHPLGRCRDAGRCEPRPEACAQVFMPVCGCDGRTYPNRCEAASEGVSVDHDGPCD